MTRALSVGSLFAGVGGFDLGFERAGMRVAWSCEIDPFCRAVLARHWPSVPCYPDVRTLAGSEVEPVEVLCGGFPCQDISLAGKGAGLGGARSSLWGHFARLAGELRPRYVVVENVPALARRGLGRVLGDLADLGYDAEWDCLPANAFGAPHRRNRLWIVAYPAAAMADAEVEPVGARLRADPTAAIGRGRSSDGGCPGGASDAGRQRRAAVHVGPVRREARQGADRRLPDADGARREGRESEQAGGRSGPTLGGRWATEPDVGRVANGIPARVDRLRGLGNALVPQIAEWIGRRIVSWES
jgi:DNA (cytosine-5)-methyltransferase 1